MKEGKIVVWLKGGDLFIFGCVGEEVEILVVVNILYEIVLGIIFSIVVSSYVGIFFIYCDYSNSVILLIGYVKGFLIDYGKYNLFYNSDMIVYYMGIKNLFIICENLL